MGNIKSPIDLSDMRIERLLYQLENLDDKHSMGINKEYFNLYIYDLWLLLELGKDYKENLHADFIKLKRWRLFLLDFSASNRQYQENSTFFESSTIKNFYIAVLIVKKFAKEYSEIIKSSPEIVRILTEYYKNINDTDEEDLAVQQKLINVVQNTWLKDLYTIQQIYDVTILNIIKEMTAAERLLGNNVWDILQEEYMEQLIDCLENNHFSEVQFWRNKIEIEKITQYEGNENSTIVLCAQQDSTIQLDLNYRLALGLTFYEKTKNYNINFILLPFAQVIERESISLNGDLDINSYLKILKSFSIKEEPINYKNVLNFAFTMLKLELSTKTTGKIILLCNELLFEYLPIDEDWQLAVEHNKQNMNVEIIVLYVGDREKLQPIWFADRVVLSQDLTAFY
ncbi:hypothetical protein DCE79_06570 [Lysinibacillus sp. 2017]|uniref:hypothetical protein n=1 Tax=unclassified Lysinibacillus TaxID=2636778 RepID=UPI000D5291D0|nr:MULTISPECIES: hypothetical protein [unclassified Lysinibacillus]AWE07090.1 hypothetical protein DCE79_06570 [Lysinibacillus sp. 2017]